jgi:mycothiol synthase
MARSRGAAAATVGRGPARGLLRECGVPEPIRTRLARREDAAAIARVYNQGIEDRVGTFETEPRTEADILAWLDAGFPVVVGELGGEVLAWASAPPYRAHRPAYSGIADFSIYVAREARGRGAGRATLSALIDECERRGYWKLVSRVFPENERSRALCRSLGFREVGTYRRHGKLDGEWRDVVIVERLLGEAADGPVLRPLRENDAEQVVALYRAAFGDERPIDAEEIRSWLRNTELQPEWLRVLELDGRVVGYGDLWVVGEDLAVEVAAPGRWERFLDWAEQTARAESVRRVRVASYADGELSRVLEARGYRPWLTAYTMRLDLGDDPPPASRLPDGIEIRTYGPEDAEPLREALNEAFAGDPLFAYVSPGYFREFYLRARGFDPALWLLAWGGPELAGFVLSFPERAGVAAGVGRVQSLGVRSAWRRRGLGEALLRAAFRELHARGLRAVELGVEAENATGAVRLYERVGMQVVRCIDNWVLAV